MCHDVVLASPLGVADDESQRQLQPGTPSEEDKSFGLQKVVHSFSKLGMLCSLEADSSSPAIPCETFPSVFLAICAQALSLERFEVDQ